jgi:NADPH:quinone reductase-like Zn-dependent oxidoreductase
MRRAILFKDNQVQLMQIPKSSIRSESDVIVRVHAAGVNALDRAMSDERIKYGSAVLNHLRGKNFVLGQEFSGVVTFVGKNVMDAKVGDEVFGAVDPWSKCGTMAEEICVNETDVAKKPASFSHEVCASLPFAIMTVWRPVIKDAIQMKARSALIWGGGGNVGSVCKELLTHLVPQMRRVVAVGREGWDEQEQFDVVVDASANQGSPVDLKRFVRASGLYCSFNGPWMLQTGDFGFVRGMGKRKKKNVVFF